MNCFYLQHPLHWDSRWSSNTTDMMDFLTSLLAGMVLIFVVWLASRDNPDDHIRNNGSDLTGSFCVYHWSSHPPLDFRSVWSLHRIWIPHTDIVDIDMPYSLFRAYWRGGYSPRMAHLRMGIVVSISQNGHPQPNQRTAPFNPKSEWQDRARHHSAFACRKNQYR